MQSGLKKPKRRIRFQTKLLLSYIVVVLIPISAWSVMSYIQTNESLLAQANGSFDDVFASAHDSMERKFSDVEKALSFVSSDVMFARILSVPYLNDYMKYSDVTFRLDPLVNTLTLLHPEIQRVNLYVANNLHGARESFRPLAEAKALPEFAELSNSLKPVWYCDGQSIFLSSRVVSEEQPLAFPIIHLEINKAYFFANNLPAELDNSWFWVEDSTGAVLYQGGATGRLPENGTESGEAPSSQRDTLLRRSAPISATPWTLHMYLDPSATLLSVPRAFGSTLTLLLVSMLLMILVSMLFSRSLTRRIRQLNAFVARAPAIRFSEDIASPGGDEISEIIDNVGHMAQETRTLIQEVYESHIQQKEAEIKALQSQINPHFLYNTLSKINWISIRRGEEDISRIVTALSTFYRSTLNHGDFVTTVRGELATTRAYVDIQLYIHGNSFDVEYAVNEDIMDYSLPSIILQPIVENAIEHGISMKSDGERGLLRLSGRKEGHDIVFEVFDNGPGLSDQEIAAIFERSSKGYGDKNVNDRLRLFFDEEYGLSFQRLDAGGLIAVIRIPQYIPLEASNTSSVI